MAKAVKNGHPHKGKKRQVLRVPTVEASVPGSLTPHATAHTTYVRGYFFGPAPDQFEEHDPLPIDQIGRLRKQYPVSWIDVTGTKDASIIARLGECFDLHPLSLEDVVHTHQRAKVEDYDNYEFIVMRMAPLEWEEETDQLGMFVGERYVITVQEYPGDDLDSVRERIRKSRGRIRFLGADYLAYSIIDAAVDAYFPLLEKNGESLAELEDDLIAQPSADVLSEIYKIRRRLLVLRRAVWPLREAVNMLVRNETSKFFTDDTRTHLRDVYDHVIQIIDLMETYRELSSNLMDVYLSSMSNRLNEVMKILTIITTIFIPLSFVAGVYGMNFNTAASPWNMPELNTRYGYVLCMLGMLGIAVLEVLYFRRKGWLKGLSLSAEDQVRRHKEK